MHAIALGILDIADTDVPQPRTLLDGEARADIADLHSVVAEMIAWTQQYPQTQHCTSLQTALQRMQFVSKGVMYGLLGLPEQFSLSHVVDWQDAYAIIRFGMEQHPRQDLSEPFQQYLNHIWLFMDLLAVHWHGDLLGIDRSVHFTRILHHNNFPVLRKYCWCPTREATSTGLGRIDAYFKVSIFQFAARSDCVQYQCSHRLWRHCVCPKLK